MSIPPALLAVPAVPFDLLAAHYNFDCVSASRSRGDRYLSEQLAKNKVSECWGLIVRTYGLANRESVREVSGKLTMRPPSTMPAPQCLTE